MDFNKIKVLKDAIEKLEKDEKKQEQFIKESMKKEINLLQNMDTNKKYNIVYEKPAWKKRYDSIKDKILFFLWKIGIYR